VPVAEVAVAVAAPVAEAVPVEKAGAPMSSGRVRALAPRSFQLRPEREPGLGPPKGESVQEPLAPASALASARTRATRSPGEARVRVQTPTVRDARVERVREPTAQARAPTAEAWASAVRAQVW
jgi:hypothetical protein